MNRFVTASRGSAEFEAYLLGSFSKTERARAVQSLNPNTKSEQVTFEILKLSEVQRPGALSFLGQWLRLRKLVIILFPVFYFLINLAKPVLDPWALLLALFSLIFLFWSVYLHNDYSDHVQGIDRVYLNSGSRAIQKGWVTAWFVKRWAWIFLIISMLLALPVFVAIPALLMVAALGGFLIYISHINPFGFFKNKMWGVWVQGFLVGPCLAVGLEILMTGTVTLTGVGFGLLWGLLVLFILLVYDFEKLVPNAQVGLNTWMVHLGFDQGKVFLQRWWIFVYVSFIVFHSIEKNWMIWMPGAAILGFFGFKFLRQLNLLKTPAGSDVIQLRQEGYQLFILTITIWSIQEVFFVFIKSVLSLWSN